MYQPVQPTQAIWAAPCDMGCTLRHGLHPATSHIYIYRLHPATQATYIYRLHPATSMSLPHGRAPPWLGVRVGRDLGPARWSHRRKPVDTRALSAHTHTGTQHLHTGTQHTHTRTRALTTHTYGDSAHSHAQVFYSAEDTPSLCLWSQWT